MNVILPLRAACARRTAAIAFVLCSIVPAAQAQNTFFSVYDQNNGATFDKVRRCANGDFVCVSDSWNVMTRTDSSGNVLWANFSPAFASVRSSAPVEDANGDLLMVSAAYDTATTRFNPALIRLDAGGNILAADVFPVDTISFWPWRSAELSNGMIAHIATAWNAQEVVIMVYDPAGPYAYPRIRIPVNFPLQGNLPAGYTGVFAGTNNTFFTYHGSYSPTMILSKYASTGAAYWHKSYVVDGGNSTIGMAGATLTNGNMALLVEVLASGPTGGEYVLLLDPSGDVISAHHLDDPDNVFDWRGHVLPMPDGSFLVHLTRVEVDPDEVDIVLHMDANANVIQQYGFEPGVYVQDLTVVDNNRIALVCNDGGMPSLSVMDLNGPFPACWQPDSVAVTTVVATASTASVASSTYTSASFPANFSNLPTVIPRTPMCSSLDVMSAGSEDELNVFPSPSLDGVFTVQGPGLSPGCLYEVFNAQGVRCAGGYLALDGILHTTLTPGAYVLRVHTKEGVRMARFVR